jgi:amino acid adenylation domain-containing protein
MISRHIDAIPLLSEWNRTQREYPAENLIQLFEKRVIENPNKIAGTFQDLHITYDELNKRANQLAHFIEKTGISSGSAIGIFVDRSIELIISFLAVLKLGSYYIPMDNNTSPALLKDIIDDANINLVLTTDDGGKCVLDMVSNTNASIIIINEKIKEINQENDTNLKEFPATALAYTLYTSGTTGKPKGVQISHRSIVNLLTSMEKETNTNTDDVFLAITPLTFDLSVPDIYLPLITGGRFVLTNPMARFSPSEIIQDIARHHVTLMQATPTTWQMLVASGWKNETNIKIITGGEALTNQLASKLIQLSDNVWNFYGPTETTVWSTYHKIKAIDKTKPYIPIGRPLANTQVFVLNEFLQPQLIETEGELYIGGDGVSAGYVNNTELNRKCFIDDPFSIIPGQKLYKTGDLVKWSVQGELEYIGRADTQMKLRGHRIEAEAIENILLDYPDIDTCIVHDQTPQNTRELVVYMTLKTNTTSVSAMQNYLRNYFPDYMIPTKYIAVDQFPVTFNGKVNRKGLSSITDYTILVDEIGTIELKNSLEEKIVDLIKPLLKREDINPEANFFNLGLHSLLLIELTDKLNKAFKQTLSVVDLFTYPSVRMLAHFLNQSNTSPTEKKNYSPSEKNLDNHIAIIGMACRLPGADSPTAYWKMILDKAGAISFFNKSELIHAGVTNELINNPDYVPARGILHNIDQFDAKFFAYTPSEASLMDPQHRVFLMQAWAALEDAGYVAETYPGKIGIFAGMSDSTYLTQNLLKNTTIQNDYDQQQLMLATSSHYLCTKIAYVMGLKGPAVTINTACSTSLVAIAMACDSLKSSQCDMVLAGGITITVPESSGYLYKDYGILSPDGHCRVFDKESKGTVLSNGCGIVVLKRLSDALKDNDNVIAVIKGWAVNNDGDTKAGFTAPSIGGQITCIQQAIANANINPEEIGYIEAHGTGTFLGDPIEITALSKGYGYENHKKNQYCAIGSVKANIGHTDVAAGVAGFIKLALALQKKTLPPHINFSGANERINLSQSPFYVNCEKKPWENTQSIRFGAVHSLGFGGTNAHMILEEAPIIKTTDTKLCNLFILSAKTPSSLASSAARFQEFLAEMSDENKEQKLADMAYTLQVGRKHFQHRLAIDYSGYDELLTSLAESKYLSIKNQPAITDTNQRIIFGFSGQGTQYVNMAADLYRNHPIFKGLIDECCETLQHELQLNLRDLLFPKPKDVEKAKEMLCNTLYAQPALFIIEYALAKLLIAFGIKPTAMIGHSLGEYVAAALAGVLSLEDSLKVIAARARLMARTQQGAMLVIPLNKEAVSSLLPDYLDFAAHNAPGLCVVSGFKKHLINFEKILQPLLEKDQLSCKYLHTSHAFHSASMDEIREEFTDIVRGYTLSAPGIPYISNLTGTWIEESNLRDPNYWAKHLRSPVLFSDGVQNLELTSSDIFIEIGAGTTLIQLVKQHGSTAQLIPSLPSPSHHQDNSYQFFLQAIGKLWQLKIEIVWEFLYVNEIRKRMSLPTYSFECQSHWINPGQPEIAARNTKDTPILYTPSWKRDRLHMPITECHEQPHATWFVFSDEFENSLIEKRMNEEGQTVYRIGSGSYFEQLTDNTFVINPANKTHYELLLQSVEIPSDNCIIVHTWLLDNAINDDTEAMLQYGAYSIMYLSQLFAEAHLQKKVNILVLSSNLYSVLGTECIFPVKTAVLGPCKVIPLEQDTIFCKVIDFETKDEITPQIADAIYREALIMERECAKHEIAYRGGYRWIRFLEPSREYIESNAKQRIKLKGVYLITGGLGGIGLALAQYLAEHYQAHLILVSRSAIVPEYEWDACIKENDFGNKKKVQVLLALQRIKNVAESLTIKQASVENEAQMLLVIQSILQRFGKIDGVIHAAGVPGGGVAHFKTIKEYHQVLQPKLQGTQNLLKLLQDQPLDFMVFISSVTSILGYPGQTDYCSANRILDAFASTSIFKHPVFCVAMNWQAWRDVGMAAESQTKLFHLDETNSNTPAEGVFLFEKILNSDLNQVIISNSDPNEFPTEITHEPINELIQLTDKTFSHDKVIPVVLNLWRKVLGIVDIQLDDDFYELGGHSLLAISLLAKIRHQFNIKISASILFKAKTVRTLSEAIQSYVQNDESPIVVLKQGGSRPPLFIVHPIGGTVFCYLPLVQLLQDDRTFYGLQDPSLELEKTLFNSIEDMATFYRKAIQKIQPEGPYYLCGASFGATVVTEIAHQLLEQNETIHFVGLIDGWAAFSNAQLDANYIETLKKHHQEHTGLSIVPQDVENRELWEVMLQHRLDMMSAYNIKKINAQLSLFKAREILPEYAEVNAKDNHWSEYSTLPIHADVIPGDHNTMLQEPNVKILAKHIQKYLDNIDHLAKCKNMIKTNPEISEVPG